MAVIGETNPQLSLLGVLATMYRSDSALSKEVLRELREVFGKHLFETVIEDDEGVAQAPAVGRSVLEYQPAGRGGGRLSRTCAGDF